MSLTKEFLNRPTNISAKVVTDSIAKNGKRILVLGGLKVKEK